MPDHIRFGMDREADVDRIGFLGVEYPTERLTRPREREQDHDGWNDCPA